MGKSAPQPPAPPNPYLVGNAQTASNVQTGIANSVLGNADERSPWGNVSYTQNGSYDIQVPELDRGGNPTGAYRTQSIPRWTRTVSLNDTQQAALDQQQRLNLALGGTALDQTQRIRTLLGTPIDAGGLPPRQANAPNAPTFEGLPGVPGYDNLTLGTINSTPTLTTNVSLGRVGSGFADPGGPLRSMNEAGPITQSLGDVGFNAQRQAYEDALFSRLNPQLERDRSALESTLVNQGLVRGSAAFNAAMDEHNRQANDARMQAVLAGGQEQSRLFNQALQQGTFANAAQQQHYAQNLGTFQALNAAQQQAYEQARTRAQFANDALLANNQAALAEANFANTALGQQHQLLASTLGFNNEAMQQQGQFNNALQQQRYNDLVNQTRYRNDNAQRAFENTLNQANFQNTQRERALQEMLALRNQPINEITALASGGQVNLPNFGPYNPAQISTTPIGDYFYKTSELQNDQYKTQVAQDNAMLGGLFGLAGNGLRLFSDRTLKRDIVDTGLRLANGVKIFLFRYLWAAERQLGFMADDVERLVPGAVTKRRGLKTVDYARVMRGA